MIKRIIQSICTVIAISGLVSFAFYLDDRWASAEEIEVKLKVQSEEILMVSKRLDNKIQVDKAEALQRRIYDLQKPYLQDLSKMPVAVRKEIDLLTKDIEVIYRNMKK